MPSPTDTDPATGQEYGRVVGGPMNGLAAVSPDHIVPKAEIAQLPRFTEPTPDQQWAVMNTPTNLAWLGRTPNKKEGSRAVENMGGVLQTWQEEYSRLQEQKRAELKLLISALADSNTQG
ncbi:hypothetical protein [Streptomyces thermogriseus]|uniref:hypothetical protein n=1 Tax=Streptomyces thermogriseus TaxID=75292 RepID=UPI0031F8EDA9